MTNFLLGLRVLGFKSGIGEKNAKSEQLFFQQKRKIGVRWFVRKLG